MTKMVLFVLCFLIIAILIISNIFYFNKILMFERELKALKRADLTFIDKKQIIDLMEAKTSSLWEFISLQQNRIEQNEEKINAIKAGLIEQKGLIKSNNQ